MEHLAETIHLITDVVMLAALLFGGVKFYFLLYYNPPHKHTEHGDSTPLTVAGIDYPRGTRNGG